MDINEILSQPFGEAVTLLEQMADTAGDTTNADVEKYQKQYDGDHAILHIPDKTATTDEGEKTVVVNKLPVVNQQKIVRLAIAFLIGKPVQLIDGTFEDDAGDDTAKAYNSIVKLWKKTKLDYFSKSVVRTVSIETRAAELWYEETLEDGTKKIGVMLLSQKNGDTFFPIFDQVGDMTAFVRKYQVADGGKAIEHIDVYTADYTYNGTKDGNNWVVDVIPELFGKIPVVYYSQETTEWGIIQRLNDRIEKLESNHGDLDDYFGGPTLMLKGDVVKAPDKETSGKILQFTGQKGADGSWSYGDAKYLTWDHSPESMKLERETLHSQIYSLTSTPDVTFDKMKSLGPMSGVAMEMLFFDAALKALDKEELYGEMFDRRINIMKSILSIVDITLATGMEKVSVDIDFQSPLPSNLIDTINTLSVARAGQPLISQQTAVENVPFVTDPEEENARLEEEQNQNQSLLNLGESFE